LTCSPGQPAMSAPRGASAATNTGGCRACNPWRPLKLDGRPPLPVSR
jgi:hypothetical protein